MNCTASRSSRRFMVVLVAALVAGPVQPALAGKGVAFIGGLIGGHVLTNAANRSERRTEAEESQAYAPKQAAPAPAPAAAPASGGGDSVKQRLQTLDKLAAGGYISKAEYTKRRQAILDSL
jgi:hypothetical protein